MDRIELATKCQLLTGSFHGRLDGCRCVGPEDCRFSFIERETMSLLPAVVAEAKKQQEKFRNKVGRT